jgi:hypothetical protein
MSKKICINLNKEIDMVIENKEIDIGYIRSDKKIFKYLSVFSHRSGWKSMPKKSSDIKNVAWNRGLIVWHHMTSI